MKFDVVVGNPPYQGSGKQNTEQKADMDLVFSDVNSYKKLDYIACWFYKGAKYTNGYEFKMDETNRISRFYGSIGNHNSNSSGGCVRLSCS